MLVIARTPERAVGNVELEVTERSVDDVLEVSVWLRGMTDPVLPIVPRAAAAKANRERVDDIDGGRLAVHECGDPVGLEAGHEQQQGKAVGQLGLALAAAG